MKTEEPRLVPTHEDEFVVQVEVTTKMTDMLEIAEALERAADCMREVAQRPARQRARELRARLDNDDTTVEVQHREDER